jgi:hypothetical protein
MTPAALVADSFGNKGRWYRARSWWDGRLPKQIHTDGR